VAGDAGHIEVAIDESDHMRVRDHRAIQLLRNIIAGDGDPDAVRSFQASVLNSEAGSLGQGDDFLRELAYDFDFYEPNDDMRLEDWSYYDKDRLLSIASDALQRLET
jgi:hypothetical protein